MVHVVVIYHRQYSRALNLPIDDHSNRRRARAILVDIECADDVLYCRASRHAACLAANQVALCVCAEVANSGRGQQSSRRKDGPGICDWDARGSLCSGGAPR